MCSVQYKRLHTQFNRFSTFYRQSQKKLKKCPYCIPNGPAETGIKVAVLRDTVVVVRKDDWLK
jgi:hypothetical protein